MKTHSGVNWSSLALACLLLAPPLFAGGPLLSATNQVLKWDPASNVPYTIDDGPLGGLTRDQGAALVRLAFQKWEDVATSVIQFADQGFLGLDVTAANIDAFFGTDVHPENPIVFDDDGQITDDFFGVGSSFTVLGFAGPRFSNAATGEILSARAVLNGVLANLPEFPSAVAHEIGHLIGLDHTQINGDLAFTPDPSDDQFIPLMYPFVIDGGTQLPIQDDIAWVSWLYPSMAFPGSTGTITGTISRRSGGFLAGANVVAVNVDMVLTESKVEIVSVVSDFLVTSDGSYLLPGLTPGDYLVFIEPLNPSFTGGSGVGPFEARFTDFVKDYYNGANESGDDLSDDPTEKVVITVAAGESVANIDLISNENTNQLDMLTDDDEVTFQFPVGFSFPFFGSVYTEVVVNSDGNLTFGAGDSASTPRDESRFLSGPPRIAPLFTDLNPEEAGEVTALVETGRITFTWESVPEFSAAGGRPGNQFSVSLFATGDILFTYQTFDVTPDASPPDDIQAIVGISPGVLGIGSPVDLSSQGSVIPIAAGPLYQVFNGNEFDLTGQAILFQASADLFQAFTNELLFPFFRGDQDNFSAYAVTSLDIAQVLAIEGRASDGSLLPFPINPAIEELDAQKQSAKLSADFFGINLTDSQSGWVRMASNTSEFGSFFQFGNGLSGPITKMDGALAFTGQSQVLYFTRLYDGLATFPSFGLAGPQDAVTTLSIANPNNVGLTLTFTLFLNTGQPAAPVAFRVLPALGSLFETVGTLFNTASPITDGFVQVDVQGPGAVGFALIELEDTILGLNASFGNNQTTLYSGQLGNGLEAGNAVFTSLKLVNTDSSPRVVTITAFRDDGSIIGLVGPFALTSNATFQRSVDQLFGLGSPVTFPLTTGSIQIDVDGPGVIGDVVFGDPGDTETGIPDFVDFAAALPLQTNLFTKAVFSQVANGATNPGDPSTDFFTGLALFNPNALQADVTVQVFDRDGSLVGETTLSLGPKQRLSELVEVLIPSTAALIRGYIVVESTQPMVSQVFFGNNTMQFLSAVPPSIIQ
ncbi:MAG: matrixin family metalloprotease [Acidobacteria bacterium]|nr:matrixin family metalloprotease [Acidobacteriota bacterium]